MMSNNKCGYLTYKVKVIPGSSITEIKKVSQAEYDFKVKVTKVAESGKANKALIDLLSNYFKVSKNSVYITSGLTSKLKVVKILIDN